MAEWKPTEDPRIYGDKGSPWWPFALMLLGTMVLIVVAGVLGATGHD